MIFWFNLIFYDFFFHSTLWNLFREILQIEVSKVALFFVHSFFDQRQQKIRIEKKGAQVKIRKDKTLSFKIQSKNFNNETKKIFFLKRKISNYSTYLNTIGICLKKWRKKIKNFVLYSQQSEKMNWISV